MSHASDSTPQPYRDTGQADRVVDRAFDHVARAGRALGATIVAWARNLRFLLFTAFLLLAVLAFWLWLASVLLAAARLLLKTVATVLMWLAGGAPRAPGVTFTQALARGVGNTWRRRLVYYRRVARPLARGYVTTRRSAVRFWRWHPAQKMAALVTTVLFVGVPAVYVVPRPQYVQILNNNAIDNPDARDGETRYLIHAVDLFDPGEFREYANVRAPHLGKIDPQGLKNRLVPGRYYRVWVVGVRWYWLPTMFPNIIRATEVDARGRTLAAPSHLIPHPTPVQPPAAAR